LDIGNVGVYCPIVVCDREKDIGLLLGRQEHGSNKELLIANDGRRAPRTDCKRGGAEVVNGDADVVPRSPHGVWDRNPLLESSGVLATQEKFIAILAAVRSVLFRPEENRLMVLLQFGIG
jgi:hypothetical protein